MTWKGYFKCMNHRIVADIKIENLKKIPFLFHIHELSKQGVFLVRFSLSHLSTHPAPPPIPQRQCTAN